MEIFSGKMETLVVGNYINTLKTAFDFNFDLFQAVKQHRSQENLSIHKPSLFLLVNL